VGYREGFGRVGRSSVSMVRLVPFGAAASLGGNAGAFAVFGFVASLPDGAGSDGLVLALSSPRAFLFAYRAEVRESLAEQVRACEIPNTQGYGKEGRGGIVACIYQREHDLQRSPSSNVCWHADAVYAIGFMKSGR
jgi:hypothetical protein